MLFLYPINQASHPHPKKWVQGLKSQPPYSQTTPWANFWTNFAASIMAQATATLTDETAPQINGAFDSTTIDATSWTNCTSWVSPPTPTPHVALCNAKFKAKCIFACQSWVHSFCLPCILFLCLSHLLLTSITKHVWTTCNFAPKNWMCESCAGRLNWQCCL